MKRGCYGSGGEGRVKKGDSSFKNRRWEMGTIKTRDVEFFPAQKLRCLCFHLSAVGWVHLFCRPVGWMVVHGILCTRLAEPPVWKADAAWFIQSHAWDNQVGPGLRKAPPTGLRTLVEKSEIGKLFCPAGQVLHQ